MTLPTEPVTLTVAQIEELNRQLAALRHDVNGHLSLVMASLELMRLKPDTRERMLGNIIEQPPKIIEAVKQFSVGFEAALGITR